MNNRYTRLILAVTAVIWIFLAMGPFPNSWAQDGDSNGLERAIKVQEANTQKLMANSNVQGTAVGLNSNGKHVVTVFIKNKGNGNNIPKKLGGIPVVTKVTGIIKAFGDTTTKWRPSATGVSTAHPNVTAGTIGARLVDGNGNVYALSNNHVYADENNASIGDNILQPGPYDGGVNPDDKFGELYDYKPIEFSRSPHTRNKIDAAIAGSTKARLNNETLDDGFGLPSAPTEERLGMKVKKYGRTTGLTYGEITDVNATVNVQYSSGWARFVDQIIIESSSGSFSDGGDSGSVIVKSDTQESVGLLFAGSDTMTVANQIDMVLNNVTGNKNNELPNLSIDDDSTGTPPAVAWSNPNGGDTVSGNVSLKIDASDYTNGVKLVEWQVDGGTWYEATYDSNSGVYTDSWDSTGVSDGDHTLSARATDGTGNVSTPFEIPVTVDNGGNSAPSVTWVNPSDGDTVSGDVSIEIDASDQEDSDSNLTVEWQVDDGTWNAATYDSNSGVYTDSWDSTGVSDGDHNLDARATDTDGALSSEDRVTVTVDNTTDSGSGSGMGVADMLFDEKHYGNGKWTDITTTVSVHQDSDGDSVAETSDDPVGGATVYMTLTHDSNGDGVFDSNDDSWTLSGETDSQGDVELTLKQVSSGDYKAEVTDITHSNHTYDSSLDADNPDYHTIN